jgi:hypothetical protein
MLTDSVYTLTDTICKHNQNTLLPGTDTECSLSTVASIMMGEQHMQHTQPFTNNIACQGQPKLKPDWPSVSFAEWLATWPTLIAPPPLKKRVRMSKYACVLLLMQGNLLGVSHTTCQMPRICSTHITYHWAMNQPQSHPPTAQLLHTFIHTQHRHNQRRLRGIVQREAKQRLRCLCLLSRGSAT